MFLDVLTADVVFDGFGYGGLVALQAAELISDRRGDAGVYDQVEQAHAVERRYLSRLVGLDVSINQMPHVGFVGFQVERFTARLLDNLADIQEMLKLLLDAGDV